ncbi:MAG: hypothetical protein LQ340_007294, partial [Diploschistes diacapsis]
MPGDHVANGIGSLPSPPASTTPRFNPRELYTLSNDDCEASHHSKLLGPDWIPVFEHGCDFDSKGFFTVLHYLVRNPNINSSLLFRADIVHDSQGLELEDVTYGRIDMINEDRPGIPKGLPAFQHVRTLCRKFIPRNDSLDRPIIQSVLYYDGFSHPESEESLVVMLPHVASAERMPFYHPTVRGIAYLYFEDKTSSKRTVSIHYQLYNDQEQVLTDRQIRIARNLLGTLCKHGQGNLEGYKKRVHHDQILAQKRVQDTFAALKRQHAHRLMQNWVESTEPKKQVFEQIGIAAFLIELWRDMYAPAGNSDSAGERTASEKPPFPGFVDVGCGNGVLVELLLCAGYSGWGIEGHRRKTWATLMPETQKVLVRGIVVPAPLEFIANPQLRAEAVLKEAYDSVPEQARALPAGTHRDSVAQIKGSLTPLKTLKSWLTTKPTAAASTATITPTPTDLSRTQNGLFPSLLPSPDPASSPSPPSITITEGQFIISNHADELTAWTPLLASLTHSAFFIVPCCSRNLSGERFRAPSYVNGFSADGGAPGYFAAQKPGGLGTKARHVAIPGPVRVGVGEVAREDEAEDPDELPAVPRDEAAAGSGHLPDGDLRSLSPRARANAKQPSAYQSLCSWVVHLADRSGYLVEREFLRIPSTRNYGIVGRFAKGKVVGEEEAGRDGEKKKYGKETGNGKVEVNGNGTAQPDTAHHQDPHALPLAGATWDDALPTRLRRVLDIVAAEGGASREKWIGVCEREVVKGKDLDHAS